MERSPELRSSVIEVPQEIKDPAKLSEPFPQEKKAIDEIFTLNREMAEFYRRNGMGEGVNW
ncbi:MAG: hypothetical protein HYT07_03665 [Candidatus Levybacteria bacterium]|nr:hypothetical protein [Candidatus Levybacteria bacterium]